MFNFTKSARERMLKSELHAVNEQLAGEMKAHPLEIEVVNALRIKRDCIARVLNLMEVEYADR